MFCRVTCGCGKQANATHENENAAIEWAYEIADAADCEYDLCAFSLECVTRTVIPRMPFRFGSTTEREMRDVLRRDPCAYCGGACAHLDHIVAKKLGGGNEVANLTAACARCNHRKRSDPLLTFLMA